MYNQSNLQDFCVNGGESGKDELWQLNEQYFGKKKKKKETGREVSAVTGQRNNGINSR